MLQQNNDAELIRRLGVVDKLTYGPAWLSVSVAAKYTTKIATASIANAAQNPIQPSLA